MYYVRSLNGKNGFCFELKNADINTFYLNIVSAVGIANVAN